MQRMGLSRLHLKKKLLLKEYDEGVSEKVLDELTSEVLFIPLLIWRKEQEIQKWEEKLGHLLTSNSADLRYSWNQVSSKVLTIKSWFLASIFQTINPNCLRLLDCIESLHTISRPSTLYWNDQSLSHRSFLSSRLWKHIAKRFWINLTIAALVFLHMCFSFLGTENWTREEFANYLINSIQERWKKKHETIKIQILKCEVL